MNGYFEPMAALSAEAPELVIALADDGVVLARETGGVRLPDAGEFCPSPAEYLLVGNCAGRRCGAIQLPDRLPPLAAHLTVMNYREALLYLPRPQQLALGRAKELLFWRRRRSYCGTCGARLGDDVREMARVCPECGSTFFPVLAPAVIVAVHRGDEILLAHNRKFRERMYGLLAGFVESGEDLEEAVHREIREEVGIEVDNLRYFGSQCWPFPNSLMVAFNCDYVSGEMRADGVELEDAGWFTADRLPRIPAPGSIAWEMIADFARKHAVELQ